jgi:hypothetical protein
MNLREIAGAVEEFIAARRRGEYFPRAWEGRLTPDDAYRLLLGIIDRCALEPGRKRIGWKVGLTAANDSWRQARDRSPGRPTVFPGRSARQLGGADAAVLGRGLALHNGPASFDKLRMRTFFPASTM